MKLLAVKTFEMSKFNREIPCKLYYNVAINRKKLILKLFQPNISIHMYVHRERDKRLKIFK